MKLKFGLYMLSTFSAFSLTAAAQHLNAPAGRAYMGLGAYSSTHVDVFSFKANQASLPGLKAAAAGLYGERRFLFSELASYTAAIGIPLAPGGFGIMAGYFGSRNYNESLLGIAYGRSLGEKASLGVQFNYHTRRIVQYGRSNAIGFEVATLLSITDRLRAGLHLSNPVGSKWSRTPDGKLPAAYAIGFGYDASEIFFVTAEINKEEGQPVNVNAGFEYRPLRQFYFRAGVSTAATTAWFGAGFSLKTFRLDLLSSYHPQLGITPGISLSSAFQQKKE